MAETSHGIGGLTFDASRRNWPPEVGVFIALILIVVVFEVLGRLIMNDSFLFNTRENVDAIFNQARLQIIILQVAIIGIIALGVTQVILTGGIDLSSGSVVGATAMTAMSFAQIGAINGLENTRAMFFEQGWVDLPVVIPVVVALACGLFAGLINGMLIAYTGIPPFIATLGMMVSARGVAKWWTAGQPVSFPTESYAAIYGKHTYAIGSNEAAARMSGIKVGRHKVLVYTIAGLLAGVAALVFSSKNLTAQAGMGVMYELDAIAMAVIGGISLQGGRGSILGTVIGALIFGVIISGFTFMRLDAYYQEMVKGAIIVGAVVLDQVRQRRAASKG
jgi:inositol transport system permease protein